MLAGERGAGTGGWGPTHLPLLQQLLAAGPGGPQARPVQLPQGLPLDLAEEAEALCTDGCLRAGHGPPHRACAPGHALDLRCG